MHLEYYIICYPLIVNRVKVKGNYRAISVSSFCSGVPLCTNIPRFILAGSRAQLEIPTKAHFMYFSGFLFPSHPSSSRGCSVCNRDGQYQNFDVDAMPICKASIYQYITIFITLCTFSLNLCKCIKYTAFCFKLLCFGDLNPPLLLKTAPLWTLLLKWLKSNLKKNLFAVYIF